VPALETVDIAGDSLGEVAMMYWDGDMSGLGYVVMTLSMVLFWVLVIGGIVLLMRFVGADQRTPNSSTYPTDPRRVLAERYARGDIDENYYRQRLKLLSGS
jgi:putative membrane protein